MMSGLASAAWTRWDRAHPASLDLRADSFYQRRSPELAANVVRIED